MPRAYYKPFTAYEEAVGFHGTKRNAYIFCGLFFGGLLFKFLLLTNYSTVVKRNDDFNLEEDPKYRAIMEERAELLYNSTSKESMRRALKQRRADPPA